MYYTVPELARKKIISDKADAQSLDILASQTPRLYTILTRRVRDSIRGVWDFWSFTTDLEVE
ncbi:hypothetical protein ACTXT7_014808 [Hymenolepis weldensis]